MGPAARRRQLSKTQRSVVGPKWPRLRAAVIAVSGDLERTDGERVLECVFQFA